MSAKFNTARPYAASYVILRREDGKVAFVLRKTTGWMDGMYGLPSGKVEKGETFTQAAVREAKEEVGVTIQAKDLRHAVSIHRDSPEDKVDGDMSWVDTYFAAKKWEGEAYNAEPTVHSELAWFGLDDLPENIIPDVKHALQCVNDGQSYGEYQWGERKGATV